MLASARGVYQGGALYFSAMSLPHLGDFALTALLGSEPIGAPLHLRGACPEGLSPKPDGVNCGCPPGSTGGGGTGALTCTPCAAGTASTLAGGECDPCPAGHFSTEVRVRVRVRVRVKVRVRVSLGLGLGLGSGLAP